MPIYDVRCESCKKEREVFCSVSESGSQVCDCGGLMRVVIATKVNFHRFRGGFHEHLAAEPIYIKSKKHLQDECRKRGLTSHYVEGGKFSEI